MDIKVTIRAKRYREILGWGIYFFCVCLAVDKTESLVSRKNEKDTPDSLSAD